MKTGFCPACNSLIVLLVEGEYVTDRLCGDIDEVKNQILIYPKIGIKKPLPDAVPSIYKADYIEVSLVIELSPKVSAAISRRCLQMFLHEHLNIKKNSLAKEIDEFIQKEKMPSYLLDAVDVIRSIGKFCCTSVERY